MPPIFIWILEANAPSPVFRCRNDWRFFDREWWKKKWGGENDALTSREVGGVVFESIERLFWFHRDFWIVSPSFWRFHRGGFLGFKSLFGFSLLILLRWACHFQGPSLTLTPASSDFVTAEREKGEFFSVFCEVLVFWWKAWAIFKKVLAYIAYSQNMPFFLTLTKF